MELTLALEKIHAGEDYFEKLVVEVNSVHASWHW